MNALLQFRAERMMSQQAAAEYCGVSERSWREWEKIGGPRNPAMRERLRQRGVIFSEQDAA